MSSKYHRPIQPSCLPRRGQTRWIASLPRRVA